MGDGYISNTGHHQRVYRWGTRCSQFFGRPNSSMWITRRRRRRLRGSPWGAATLWPTSTVNHAQGRPQFEMGHSAFIPGGRPGSAISASAAKRGNRRPCRGVAVQCRRQSRERRPTVEWPKVFITGKRTPLVNREARRKSMRPICFDARACPEPLKLNEAQEPRGAASPSPALGWPATGRGVKVVYPCR